MTPYERRPGIWLCALGLHKFDSRGDCTRRGCEASARVRPAGIGSAPPRPAPEPARERKGLRCRLGIHDFAQNGCCVRRGCDAVTEWHGRWPRPVSVGLDMSGGVGGLPVIGSGEHEARGLLLLALGPQWNVEYECGGGSETFRLIKEGEGTFELSSRSHIEHGFIPPQQYVPRANP